MKTKVLGTVFAIVLMVSLSLNAMPAYSAGRGVTKDTIKMGAVPKWVTALCVLPKTQLSKNASNYGLKFKLRTFDDFMAFSTEKANRGAYYPHCITHETDLMDIYDILKAVNELKSLILSQKE